MKYRLISFLSITFTLLACQSQETDSGNNEGAEPPVNNKDAISVSERALILSPETGSAVSVDITTEGDWSISGLSEGVREWLDAAPTEGHGNATVTFTCTAFNPYNEERMAVITFLSGKASAPVVIHQSCDPDRSITLSEDILEFDGTAGQQKTITLNTTKPWTVDDYSEEVSTWIKLSSTSGKTGGEITVTTPVLYEELDPRSANITFSIDRIHSASLTITQACGIELSLDKTQLDFNAEGNQTLSLSVKCNAVTKSWQIVGVDASVLEWLDFSATSGTGDQDVAISTKSENKDAVRQASFTVKVDDQHTAVFTVTQSSSMEIHVTPVELVFSGENTESKNVTVTSTTASIPWYIEGYTDDVKAWLSIDTETASALESTISIATLSLNESIEDRKATLRFHLTDSIFDEITVTQPMKPLQQYIITWKAGTVGSLTVKGGEMSPHDKFPWADAEGWATLSNVNKEYKNGKGGEVVRKGDYAVTATWLFQDFVTKEWIPLEMGPIREPVVNAAGTGYTVAVYYMNHESANIRWGWSYIKIPAKAGYRLTHVKMTAINAASNATLLLGTNKNATNGFLEESANRVTFGKNDPLDRELSTTEPNTDYYLGCVLDRQFDSFEFTYTEVR